MPSIRQFPQSSLPFIITEYRQSISPQFLNTNSESLVNKRWPELLEYLIPRIRQFVTKFIRQSPRITRKPLATAIYQYTSPRQAGRIERVGEGERKVVDPCRDNVSISVVSAVETVQWGLLDK